MITRMILALPGFLPRLRHHQYLKVSWLGQSIWWKDVSDEEWVITSKFFVDIVPWLAVHLVGAQLLRKNKKEVRYLYRKNKHYLTASK